FGFQRTRPTIRGPGAIEKNIAIVDPACRVQKLALRAYIDVPILVEGKVLSAQRAIFVLGFLNDRNVRSDPLLVDDPVERRRRSGRSALGSGQSSSSRRRPPLGEWRAWPRRPQSPQTSHRRDSYPRRRKRPVRASPPSIGRQDQTAGRTSA